MHDIIVPFEQEGTKAVVRAWLKQVGDAVREDEPLVELETDKVTQEVSATVGGVLIEILIAPDSDAVPGAILGRIKMAGEADVLGKDSSALPVITGAVSSVGCGAASDNAQATALSPAVRRAVQQHKVDPATITGSGRGGRVTRADVDAVVAARASGTAAPGAYPIASPMDVQPALTSSLAHEQPASASSPVRAPASGVRSIPHDRMRLAIAANMLGSVTTAPHVTAVFEADFSAIVAHRRKHKALFEASGVNLTYTAYMIAASVAAMRAVPVVNSRWYDDHLDVFDDVNTGVGTALGDKGLIVPVVQHAQELSLLGIATRLGELVARARDGKLSGSDVRGGTFTISNHGVSGSLLATPIIINQPQSAILGVGKLEKRVVVRETGGSDAMLIRPMAYVSLTIDHRAIDGHQTNAWLSKFVETLESWPL